MHCIFCDIVDGKAKAEILFEDNKIISFLDINPLNYGHSLVIPKKHFENFFDVPIEELSAVIKVTQMISKAVKDSLKSDGINVISNNGSAAGQSIFHFHFHIIPRFINDDLKFKLNLKSYSYGLKKEFGDKIRLALKV